MGRWCVRAVEHTDGGEIVRVLIAEDDPVSRLMLQATLRKCGHDAVVACDGREALSILEQDAAPELAILDWMMPEMDGPEVCRRIRQNSTSSPVYIILLTAKSQRGDLIVGLGAGADDYIPKPFNHQELYARLQIGFRVADLQRKLADRVNDLEIALMRLGRAQQARKLEALGQMASGIAHEINTPTQYIGDNVRFLQDSWTELRPFLECQADNADLDYLIREVPKAIDESLQGIQKVGKIVRAMRDFAHPPSENKVHTDINHAVLTTITVATNEWKYVADIETSLDPQLPRTPCFPGEIQQVLLNLLVNAAQAIADSEQKGVIRVATSTQTDSIEIRVSDSGRGIPREHREKVFEPFFTTKDVGEGTGQGLAVAYSVIVHQHNGKIWFDSESGKGTTFYIRLPIDGIGFGKNEYEEAHFVR